MIQLFPQALQHKFTKRAQGALEDASQLAGALIKPNHLFFGILLQQGCLGKNVLQAHGISLKSQSRSELQVKLFGKPTADGRQRLTPSFKTALKRSMVAASWHGQRYVGTEHLLYGLLKVTKGRLPRTHQKLLNKSLVAKKAANIISHLEEIFTGSGKFPDVDLILEHAFEREEHPPLINQAKEQSERHRRRFGTKQIQKQQSNSLKALEKFCRDLVADAEEGKFDPVIGREEELQRLIRILSRRIKNNPIIVGEPGVGKTAIVYGLAQKIAKGEVPHSLLDRKIYSVDLGLLVSGTIFRGEFEARLKEIIQAASRENITLFIDEIHNIIGAGSAQGSLDAANMLKPPLSRGELQIIGATTYDEYRRYFEKDKALERRFQPIFLDEMSGDETLAVLKSLRPTLEQYYDVQISDVILKKTVQLSERHLSERTMPDKAIDLLDESCAQVRIQNSPNKAAKQIRILEKKLARVLTAKEKAVADDDFEEALHYKKKEASIKNKIMAAQQGALRKDDQSLRYELRLKDLTQVIADITHIPSSEIEQGDEKRLLVIEKAINANLVGQATVTKHIAKALRRARLRLTNDARPIASMFFLGPTGVGKTEAARLIATHYYNSPAAFVKLDMSEFMEPHSVARLLGAPAGYVGYEEGGELTERVRRNPHCLVLFDEIEKAHPNVTNILLQILEDGVLTDAQGRRTDFSNAILIMTSNIGGDYFLKNSPIGFGQNASRFFLAKDEALRTLKNHLRPELLARIEQVFVFHPLGPKELEKIAKKEIAKLKKQLAQQSITLLVDPLVARKIARISFDPRQGARLVIKNVRRLIEDPLTELLLKKKADQQTPIRIILKNNRVVLK